MIYWARVAISCPEWEKPSHCSTFVEATDPDNAIAAAEEKIRSNLVLSLAIYNTERGTDVGPDQVIINVLKVKAAQS